MYFWIDCIKSVRPSLSASQSVESPSQSSVTCYFCFVGTATQVTVAVVKTRSDNIRSAFWTHVTVAVVKTRGDNIAVHPGFMSLLLLSGLGVTT